MARPGPPASVFRFPRRRLQLQLALFYAGVFLVSGVALLAIPGIALIGVKSTVHAGTRSSASAIAQHGTDVRQQVIGSAVALAITVVLSLVLGWLIAGRLLRPLRTITATARDISASNLHQRLRPGDRGDEFTELARTLNDLFGRLEASFESQRHFVANASHELRTPLTAERTLIQVALADPGGNEQTLRAACQQVLALGEQQERLIEALLTLASSERGIQVREPFDLAEITRRVLLVRRQEAGRRGISVGTRLAAAPAAGDPSLAESLVANLVDNALRHNAAGGQVEISTAATAGGAHIWVSNTGTVIPPGEVERLFRPFQQLGPDRVRRSGGHGLGLAIVHAIAAAHGAAVRPRARPEGGLDIDVSFPREGDQPAGSGGNSGA
ncbi:MAG TPA: ATP-binding protein [Streptosporangiaceae bacterium]|jgi:signal transduction histidine kinase